MVGMTYYYIIAKVITKRSQPKSKTQIISCIDEKVTRIISIMIL